MTKILVTGGLGQIGSELTAALKNQYGKDQVVTCDLAELSQVHQEFHPYEKGDVLNAKQFQDILKKHQITEIYHLAAILSAVGEQKPQHCWKVNIDGLYNVLEASIECGVKKVVCPSSIAVFGPETPQIKTPQETILLPKTMYGLTKVAGELLCDYYVSKFNLDVRGLRYPGLISYKTLPGGGTTDYAVEIFYAALKGEKYTCFLKPDTVLPMMYMPDAVRGTIELAETSFKDLKHHSNFNFASMSFSCQELADEIKKHIPNFQIEYVPDHRQQIAETWPQSIDDCTARKEWNWKPQYDLKAMVKDMLHNLKQKT
ncbi:MAG: putative epimerase/dehydratase [Chlamydiae bacterium]|nr:putative epimerase/dehydratase [Chlamydiota bacterium]